jgi:hypothetical protein
MSSIDAWEQGRERPLEADFYLVGSTSSSAAGPERDAVNRLQSGGGEDVVTISSDNTTHGSICH